MNRWALTALATLLLTCAQAGTALAGSDPWIQLAEKKYGFQVMMPEQPEEVMSKKNYYVGDVVNHVFTATENEQIFKVDYSQLPSMAVSFVGADQILDHTRSGILCKEFGKQISYTDTTVGKYKAKKLVYETAPTNEHPGMRGEAEFFLKGHNLYVVEVITPKSQLPGNAKKFFGSFQVD